MGLIPKIAADDTVLVTTNHDGQTRHIPIQTGTSVMINVVGLHYNRKWTLIAIPLDPSSSVPVQLDSGIIRPNSSLIVSWVRGLGSVLFLLVQDPGAVSVESQ